MNIVSLIAAVTRSTDLWSKLISILQGAISNYGWTILLLTILVKVVISPLDFAVKLTTKKQNLVQQKCAPQIAKLNKKFGKDQQTLKIQTQALYKREGMKAGVGCVVMLLNLVLTMVIFFTFYASLRKVSAYEAINQYEILQQVYDETYDDNIYGELVRLNDEIEGYEITSTEVAKELMDKYEAAIENTNKYSTEESRSELSEEELAAYEEDKEFVNSFNSALENVIDEIKKNAASDVIEKWQSIKASWLWVDNIWVADATTSPFLTYSNLLTTAKNGGYSSYVADNIDEERYNTIAAIVNTYTSRNNNGFYILAILAGVVTFLTQYIAELHTKLKNKKANIVSKATGGTEMAGTMKIMKFIMPVIMIIFVLSASASFGIYILASNLTSIVLGEISTLIISKITKKKQEEVESYLEKEANRMIKKGQIKE